MPRDIEAELRRSLQARANDVSPDPALFARIQARVRRGRNVRLAFAGAGAALAVAAAAVAAPAVINRRVEFEPAPVTSQPPAAPTETTAPGEPAVVVGSADLVFSDGASVFTMPIDGESPETLLAARCPEGSTCDYEPHRNVTTRPAAAAEDAVAVSAAGCGGLWRTDTDDQFLADMCAGSAVFSPDGRHLAYVAPADGDGSWFLHTVDWTDEGPGEDDASFALDFSAEEHVRIEDWTWFRNDAEATEKRPVPRGVRAEGDLYFQVTSAEQTTVLSRRIERQADGALALPDTLGELDLDLGSYQPVAVTSDYSAVAFSSDGGPGGQHPEQYVVEMHVAAGEVDAGHIANGFGDYLDLPATLLETIDVDNLANVWVAAAGTDLVVGDGHGSAWAARWDPQGDPNFVRLDADIVHADLFREVVAQPAEGDDIATEPPPALTEVEVHFGMGGEKSAGCIAEQVVTRAVEGPGVARGALTQLLQGPSSRESNEGISSPFSAKTADALNDIQIVDGQAIVDFRDFREAVDRDACTKSEIVSSLNATLLQFDTIKSTQYSFDGDVEAWNMWLGPVAQTPPPAVVETQKEIYAAAKGRDWKALRRLSKGTSCTLSDQPEPCVPYWKDQEANGGDPLRTLVELLEGPAAKDPDAPMWVWPEEWVAPRSNYNGPRVGIANDGRWRFYVQEGG